MRIKQGDAKNIDIVLNTETGAVITGQDASAVEISIGHLTKTYPGELIASDVLEDVWPGDIDWTDKYVTMGNSGGVRTFSFQEGALPDFPALAAGDIIDISIPGISGRYIENARVISSNTNVLSVEDSAAESQPVMLDGVIIKHHTCVYTFPLSQEETFKLDGVRPIDARVKFGDDSVAGTSLGIVVMDPTTSKEVL